MKILIPDDYQNASLQLNCIKKLYQHEILVLGNLQEEENLAEQIKDIEAIILIRERTIINQDLLKKCLI
ncbi:Rossmann-fold NAD(P)-binding domain-containing protein [Commensalibacter nepenthis]|uniref:Uncharacterized protein n=1 Tax=Commensalibacter nepenthis TaxID=3043872 RepID=A0ABT6Q777_9PROT|nr:hypothetical protein [Commensalibacter sp. TBRC 10068]MDI2112748.1 hypothetical protein [Commensalibacter sp. TBRC 10068]MDI2113968.1 hypothetical protein [Commensalibacter sp. TBRC 10068]MDI2113971.1 hypothetical protein [Commensalibacter sp. TBRC 10068]